MYPSVVSLIASGNDHDYHTALQEMQAKQVEETEQKEKLVEEQAVVLRLRSGKPLPRPPMNRPTCDTTVAGCAILGQAFVRSMARRQWSACGLP